jgi:hypothetical protein
LNAAGVLAASAERESKGLKACERRNRRTRRKDIARHYAGQVRMDLEARQDWVHEHAKTGNPADPGK